MTAAARFRAAFWGLLVGDALGVPYEFRPAIQIPPASQIQLRRFPAGWGKKTYPGVPLGSWSDDGALMLALSDALAGVVSSGDTAALSPAFQRNAVAWCRTGKYAAARRVFDIGNRTAACVRAWAEDRLPAPDINAEGNGALMRVLPLAFLGGPDPLAACELARDNSALTHGPLSAVACAVYVVMRLKYPIDVLGAFFAPVALTFLLASQVIGTTSAEGPDEGMKSAILPIHIVVNLLGEALFLLAFAAAVAYLVQENQLRSKKLGGIMQRLPPLDALDRAEHRFLLAGFPLLTIGILTGTLWARRVEAGSAVDVWRAAFGYATWVLFAVVLLLRAGAGWRGRRAAYGTIAGFAFAVVVLVIYLVRSLSAPSHLALLGGP